MNNKPQNPSVNKTVKNHLKAWSLLVTVTGRSVRLKWAAIFAEA